MFQVPVARRCHGWAGKAKLVMSHEQQASRIQDLIKRVQRGDQEARRELIDCAYERLRRLSAVILRKSFPRLKDSPSLVETTETANEAAYRLYQALAEIAPANARDFFRLAAQRIRWLLLDIAREADRGGQAGIDDPQRVESYDKAWNSHYPAVVEESRAALDRWITETAELAAIAKIEVVRGDCWPIGRARNRMAFPELEPVPDPNPLEERSPGRALSPSMHEANGADSMMETFRELRDMISAGRKRQRKSP